MRVVWGDWGGSEGGDAALLLRPLSPGGVLLLLGVASRSSMCCSEQQLSGGEFRESISNVCV